MHKQTTINIRGKDVLIDTHCVQLVEFFNSIGLDTKYSCQGDMVNPFYIMFEDYIEDDKIEGFLQRFPNKYGHTNLPANFVKWCRLMNGHIKYNWMLQSRFPIISINKMADIFKKEYNKYP